MKSLFAEVIFTMDDSPGFYFLESKKVLRKGYHQKEHLKGSTMVQISAS